MPDDAHGHVSGGNAVSAVIARLYHGIEATSCQAERKFSALAHLIDDLCSSMLASKAERMMFIQLNRHLIDEVREFDAAVAHARARVAKVLSLRSRYRQITKSRLTQKKYRHVLVLPPPPSRYRQITKSRLPP